MAEKFKNKYRISSIRLQNWDYGWGAAYFITICTQNREYYFGNIVDKCMILLPAGKLADLCWHKIKNHTKNVELGPFVVMPDHIHGILILPDNNAHNKKNDNNNDDSKVQTRHALSQKRQLTIGQQRFQNQGKNTISSIIGSYKSAVTKQAHRMGIDFAWQPRFYDHIIRDGKSYDRIKNYINENPFVWKK